MKDLQKHLSRSLKTSEPFSYSEKENEFFFFLKKKIKIKEPKNWFRKLIRNLRAFKDCDCIRLVPVRKNSWRQELLHSRTAGAERVNVLPSLSLCVVCLLVCLFVNLPQLKPSGSLSVG